MRWPIQFQLLLPMLTVVVLAIALASAASAYFGAMRARQTQEDNLHRVVDTLTEAKFPLTESVLRQMSGLSGAKFVLLDLHDAMQASTLPVDADELERLRRIPRDQPSDDLAARPTVSVGGRSYLSQRVTVAARDPPSRRFALRPLSRRPLVGRDAAGGLSGAYHRRGRGRCRRPGDHGLGAPFRAADPAVGRAAAAIARGDFQPMPLSPRNDEIRDLAVSINRMTEQLGSIRNRGPPPRATPHARATGRRHGPPTPQCGHRRTHGHRTAPARMPGGRVQRIARRRLAAASPDGVVLAAVPRAGPRPGGQPTNGFRCRRSSPTPCRWCGPPASHAGIDLVFHQPSTPLWVMGDAEALRQLTVNLVLNAVEALGSRPEHARIVVELESQDGADAALRVHDTGPGPTPTWPNGCSSRSSPASRKAPAWGFTSPVRWPRPITARSAGSA